MNRVYKATLQKRSSGLYETLKRAKLPFLTEHNAVYGLDDDDDDDDDDAVMVLLYSARMGLLPTGP